ncbi:hypothetical protein ACFV3R_16720 [Streptomyces sp. NPDC059740]|uniref:hypothetical protein n=1 Tax=Streptomyces sp. NPDC059740 TaxID=3346926 RepID=UPI00364B13DC
MSGSTRAMAVLTTGGLVAASAYSVALGGDGWLWFAWVVTALTTLGVAVSSRGT